MPVIKSNVFCLFTKGKHYKFIIINRRLHNVIKRKSHTKQPIAVVGVGAYYPGAKNAKELWLNILSKRSQFRTIPHSRLPPNYMGTKTDIDKTYAKKMAVLDGYKFDWLKRKIPKTTYESTDIVHWLALDVTLSMLEDAGYPFADGLNKDRCQVIIGNTLTGEMTRSQTLRYRWPFVENILNSTKNDLNLSDTEYESYLSKIHRLYKSHFKEPNEDSLAGGLANTIAGRICNFLDLKGGGYIVDGACSSSLLSIYLAAEALSNKNVDFVIAGGIDISLDPFELVGFSRVGALTDNEMRVYDKRGNGFIPGEGCGIIGLKRLDSVTSNDKIYAILDKWGMSSDGKGGITAPNVNGQSLAILRAYSDSDDTNYNNLKFIEGHGTGTTVGDETELMALSKSFDTLFSDHDNKNIASIGMTSLKSLIGHTKAASGIGAFLKAVFSVNRSVIPPLGNKNIFLAHPVFSDVADRLYPVLKGEIMEDNNEIRAGVSGMGFGGINVHCSVKTISENMKEQHSLNNNHWLNTINHRNALSSSQDSELFVFAENDNKSLIEQLNILKKEIINCTDAELTDLSAHLISTIDNNKKIRASIVASNVDEFTERIDKLLDAMKNPTEQIIVDERNYFTLGIKNDFQEKVNIGFVFPGQASQDINMSRILYERFEWAQSLVDKLATDEMKQLMFPKYFDQINSMDMKIIRNRLSETRLTQPCIVLSSLLWATHLTNLGIKPMVVAGHSLGELNALAYANAFDQETLIELARIRGYSMSKYATKPGSMLNLQCSKTEAQELIDKLSTSKETCLNIANINSPTNTVLSGDIESIDKMYDYAGQCKINATKIPVSGAFHSVLMEPASNEFYRQINELNLTMPSQSYSIPIISSKTGLILDSNTDLSSHLCSCLTSPVEWISAVNSMTGVLTSNSMVIEVGPKKVLNNLISSIKHGNIDQNSNVKYVNSVEGKIGSFTDLNWSIATLFANGFDVDLSYLHKNRIIQSWIPPSQKSFIVNPCERLMFPENGFEYSAINCFADGDQQNKINLNNINPCCSHLFPATASTEIAKTHVFSSTTNCKATSKSTSKAKTKPKSKSKAKPISKTKSKKKSHRKTKSPIQTQLPLRRSVRLRNKRETAMTPY
eukprot:440410_1